MIADGVWHVLLAEVLLARRCCVVVFEAVSTIPAATVVGAVVGVVCGAGATTRAGLVAFLEVVAVTTRSPPLSVAPPTVPVTRGATGCVHIAGHSQDERSARRRHRRRWLGGQQRRRRRWWGWWWWWWSAGPGAGRLRRPVRAAEPPRPPARAGAGPVRGAAVARRRVQQAASARGPPKAEAPRQLRLHRRLWNGFVRWARVQAAEAAAVMVVVVLSYQWLWRCR